jgi:hypothetical protein
MNTVRTEGRYINVESRDAFLLLSLRDVNQECSSDDGNKKFKQNFD